MMKRAAAEQREVAPGAVRRELDALLGELDTRLDHRALARVLRSDVGTASV